MREPNTSDAPKRLVAPKLSDRRKLTLEERIVDLEITARELLRITDPPRSWDAASDYRGVTPLYDGIVGHAIQRIASERIAVYDKRRDRDLAIVLLTSIAISSIVALLLVLFFRGGSHG